jgi:hypothetical protein
MHRNANVQSSLDRKISSLMRSEFGPVTVVMPTTARRSPKRRCRIPAIRLPALIRLGAIAREVGATVSPAGVGSDRISQSGTSTLAPSAT